ncbi:MAG: hypothetical protein JWO03_727, partial [Bacteroidetes bacterium]|nr:hypothetical protein [Bacteroidota bacterium]
SGAVANSLTFSYSTTATTLTTGSYTAATALDYTSTVAAGGAAGALNGNATQTVKTATITLATPLASGGSIWLKWTDIDNSGSDMGIALDDLTVILYNNTSTLLATPAASVSTSTLGAGGTMTAADYTAAAVTTGGVYNVVVSNVVGCSATASTTVVVNSPATAQANTTPTATITNAATYTLSGSATNYASYAWSTNGAGVLNNTNTLTPFYDPAQNETGNVTITLTVTALAPCASPVVDSMVLHITPAAGNTWLGINTDWFNVANWTSGVAPNGCNAIANIPVVGSNIYPVINATSPQVGNLTINSGASITINSGKTLGVCGNWTGGSTTSANILGAGGVVFNGTTAQTVSGKNSFTTLTVNKTAGTTTFTGANDISTAFIMTRGNVVNSAATNGSITLKSDAIGTAYLDNFTSGTAGTYTGNLTVERYSGTNTAIGYRDISSPVNAHVGQWSDDFLVNGLDGVNCWYAYNPYPTLQYYNESANSVTANYYGGFISTTDVANILTAAKGYAARLYTLPVTINTTGTPNTGAQSIGITKTTSSIPSADGWNLLGNPYPSSVSWNAIKALNAGKTDGSVYRFTSTGEYTGNYATWNGTTGTNGATDQIASTEGFWVLASANNTIDMDNTVRVASTSSPFFKTASAQPDEIRLNLTNGLQTDEIVEYTDPAATSGYDPGYDAAKMAAGSTVYLSFDMPAREMAINVLNEVTVTTELPLRIVVSDSGSYTLTATVLNLTDLTAYLKDADAGTYTDLSAGPVTLTLAANHAYAGRYSVVFRKKTATAVANVDEHSVQIYAYDGKVFINRPSTSAAVINISNILGQQIAEVTSSQEKTIIPMPATEPWYALVKVTEGSNVTVKKVLISTK